MQFTPQFNLLQSDEIVCINSLQNWKFIKIEFKDFLGMALELELESTEDFIGSARAYKDQHWYFSQSPRLSLIWSLHPLLSYKPYYNSCAFFKMSIGHKLELFWKKNFNWNNFSTRLACEQIYGNIFLIDSSCGQTQVTVGCATWEVGSLVVLNIYT